MWDPYSEFQTTVLPNGLTLHEANWPGRPWEIVRFLVHSGAEHDPENLVGVAHFVEHMVSENSNTPKKEMEDFFNNLGGSIDLGVTSYPYTGYGFFTPTDRGVIKKAFSMFGYMLLSAKLKNFMERERRIITDEFYEQYPFKFNFDFEKRERRALYAGNWLEKTIPVLGNPDVIKIITQEDLQSYYDEYYTPANISVIAVGGMPPQELGELLVASPLATNKKGFRTPLPLPTADALMSG